MGAVGAERTPRLAGTLESSPRHPPVFKGQGAETGPGEGQRHLRALPLPRKGPALWNNKEGGRYPSESACGLVSANATREGLGPRQTYKETLEFNRGQQPTLSSPCLGEGHAGLTLKVIVRPSERCHDTVLQGDGAPTSDNTAGRWP